jgi:hypothetical protein
MVTGAQAALVVMLATPARLVIRATQVITALAVPVAPEETQVTPVQ